MPNTQAIDPRLQYDCCAREPRPLTQAQVDGDQERMQQCLDLLGDAQQSIDIPIGALLWDPTTHSVLAKAHNRSIQDCDATAHAEINVIRHACQQMGNYRLSQTVLYVTLEPCQMCFGALMAARVSRIVFAASDQKVGWLSQQQYLQNHARGNHHFQWTGGVLAAQAAKRLRCFFRDHRR